MIVQDLLEVQQFIDACRSNIEGPDPCGVDAYESVHVKALKAEPAILLQDDCFKNLLKKFVSEGHTHVSLFHTLSSVEYVHLGFSLVRRETDGQIYITCMKSLNTQ